MAVTVSESAAREIHDIVKRQELDVGAICLRVGVKGGGCAGFSYLLDLTETRRDSDEGWEYSYTFAVGEDGIASVPIGGAAVQTDDAPPATSDTNFSVRVICDPKSYLYLNGTDIDFKDENMLRGFVFNNPNATSSCGCGSSFAV